jgi:hypothetical protein
MGSYFHFGIEIDMDFGNNFGNLIWGLYFGI